jgi:putative sigma-54 modulation protein
LLFKITGKHIDITEALRKHAEEKTSKLPRYYNSINQVEVIIDNGQSNIEVEIIARGEHSNIFVVKENGQDAYQCIDTAVHKLERQIRRKKTRERNNKHNGGNGNS